MQSQSKSFLFNPIFSLFSFSFLSDDLKVPPCHTRLHQSYRWFIFLNFSGRVGFFDISTDYTVALMSSVVITLGFLLVIDLALGQVNVFNIVNGLTPEAPRAGRGLLDPLYSLLPSVPRLPDTEIIREEAISAVAQISEAIEKFENRNNPRAF